jgi:hypothetical protein
MPVFEYLHEHRSSAYVPHTSRQAPSPSTLPDINDLNILIPSNQSNFPGKRFVAVDQVGFFVPKN